MGRPAALVRGFIDGVALHVAKPQGDAAYFRSAKQALRKLHRAGICHNDLAKEQNWLRGTDGSAYLTDFQLAVCFNSRSKLFRIAAYEDLRHLLKHKRSYVPDALTPTEAQDPGAQDLADAHLAGDRQAGLPRHHPRPVRLSPTAKAAARGWSTTRR